VCSAGGPPPAAMIVVTAQRGGTFRETLSIATASVEARQLAGSERAAGRARIGQAGEGTFSGNATERVEAHNRAVPRPAKGTRGRRERVPKGLSVDPSSRPRAGC
jgi:hypothetical protein